MPVQEDGDVVEIQQRPIVLRAQAVDSRVAADVLVVLVVTQRALHAAQPLGQIAVDGALARPPLAQRHRDVIFLGLASPAYDRLADCPRFARALARIAGRHRHDAIDHDPVCFDDVALRDGHLGRVAQQRHQPRSIGQ